MYIDFLKLRWICDKHGYQVGYSNVSIVSVYELEQYGLTLLIDVDDVRILEAYVSVHEDERIDDREVFKVDDAFLYIIHNALKEMNILDDEL